MNNTTRRNMCEPAPKIDLSEALDGDLDGYEVEELEMREVLLVMECGQLVMKELHEREQAREER